MNCQKQQAIQLFILDNGSYIVNQQKIEHKSMNQRWIFHFFQVTKVAKTTVVHFNHQALDELQVFDLT